MLDVRRVTECAAGAEQNAPSRVPLTAAGGSDSKSGRVRVALDYFDDSFQGAWFSERVTVPGLVFDRASGEIRYQAGGSSVTCATARKLLWTTSYPLNAGCRISVSNSPDSTTATIATVRLTVEQPERAAALKTAR
jgi:hypothetical protein